MAQVVLNKRSGNSIIDTMISHYKWNTNTITFSFIKPGSKFIDNYGSGEPTKMNGYCVEAEKQAFRRGFTIWTKFANLKFVEKDDVKEQGMLRIGRSHVPPTAWGYFPWDHPTGGDIWLGSKNHPDYSKGYTTREVESTYEEGTYHFHTLIHEIGHVLGLKHPHDKDNFGSMVSPAQDWLRNSLMSYRDSPGAPLDGYANFVYPRTPMQWDIDAIQYLYGAPTNSSGNNTYTYTKIYGGLMASIYDRGGIDTLNFSESTSVDTIELDKNSYSDIGPVYRANSFTEQKLFHIDKNTVIENVITGSQSTTVFGNTSNNTVTGNNGADSFYGEEGNDTLKGGNGNDKLFGGSGKDILYGQAGNDEMRGNTDNDTLYGGPGNDTIYGDEGNDILHGEDGNDIMYGGAGDDQYIGGKGNDIMYNDAGNDKFNGQEGTDIVYVKKAFKHFSITRSGSTITLVDKAPKVGINYGTDIIYTTVEKIIFDDYTYFIK